MNKLQIYSEYEDDIYCVFTSNKSYIYETHFEWV